MRRAVLLLTLLIVTLAAGNVLADAQAATPPGALNRGAPVVEPRSAGPQTLWRTSSAMALLDEPSPEALVGPSPTLTGDWSNAAAWGCITPLGLANNAAFGAGLASAPPFDFYAAMAEYAANLGLKFCAPVLYTPDDFARAHNVDNGGQCGFTFNQPRLEGQYKNYMGFTLPWGDVFPGKDWGDFGQPVVLHWNTDVDVSLRVPGATAQGGGDFRLPVGVHTLTWRGDTLVSALDFVPRYIPGWAWTRMNKLFKLKGAAEEAAETTLETVIDLAAGELEFIPSWPTMYNEEFQRVAVTDGSRPVLNGPATTQIEAIEPGGVSQATFLYLMKRTLSVYDNCDAAPDIFPENAHSLPDFVAVGGGGSVTWIAEDSGPQDLSGERNRSLPLPQQFVVADTLAPIIVPPPDIVTETTGIPAALNLGHPGTFDLADLNPTVSHNACSLAGVICSDSVVRFPAGKTTVTWTAVDHAGNTSSTSQYVNVKNPGSNRAPTASGGASEAISYEPITITLQAGDPDDDRLWFQIQDPPDNGFFHAPLYPYFIQDYRLANVQDISFSDYCADPDHQQHYVPTNWPVNATFMAVGDDGTIYVHDQGRIWCQGSGDVSQNYRLAVFHPDGTWEQTASSSDVHDVYVDWGRERLFKTQSDNDGVAWIREYDLDLNQLAQYRLDDAVPTAMSMDDARQGLIDEQGIIYVTNGFEFNGASQLRLYTAEYDTSQGIYPQFLANYSLPGAVFQDLALDSEGNLYASERNSDRIYKWSPATLHPDGSFTPGQLMGWMGRCDGGPGCDLANGRSFGYGCSDAACTASTTGGNAPGQFDFPRGIALDNNDILYVTDYSNQRIQRFTPEGYFAGQAISECDGSCFVLGDFGSPKQVTVNSNNFYVLDDGRDLLHVFETTPLTRTADDEAQIVYQSNNNFVGTDHFSYRVSDGLDDSVAQTITIDVSRNYRPPVALGPLAASTEEDLRVALPLDGYDPDEQLDTLTFETVQPPANGRFERQGDAYYYVPDADFEGTDVFTYAANDGVFLSEEQSVTVTVTPVNDMPRFPEGTGPARPAGFALHTAGAFFSMGRLAPLGASGDPMRVGRGFNTVFSLTFEDPDDEDVHTVNVSWGDGSPVEAEGDLLEDGTMTGPVLSEGVSGGTGSITAEHVFHSSGDYTVEICVSDNVAVDENGNKTPTPASTTTCTTLPVSVAPMVDLLVDIRPSANPYAAGDPLAYDLIVTNHAPEDGAGLTASGLVITDTLDTRLTMGNATVDGGSCDTAGHVAVCMLDPLAPGESVTIHVSAQVPASIEPGMLLANHVAYALEQENQAAVRENGDLVTVVAPADFVVNTIADGADAAPGDGACATGDGDCSLRAAVQEANARPGAQTISLADWQVTLQSELAILQDLTISGLGAGQTIIGGNGQDRLFDIASGAHLSLAALTLQGGSTEGDGGALYNAGAATLTAVQVSGNDAGSAGGAIYNAGDLSIFASAISGNGAINGAGAIENGGTLLLQNVTISGNQGAAGGLVSSGSATLENVTIARNHATDRGGGLSGSAANFRLHNTIVALNTAGAGHPDCHGGLTSLGHNLLGNPAGCAVENAVGSDLLGVQPRLAPLDMGPGNTLSHALLGGGPAIDAGACQLATDQHGLARPVDGNLDGVARCDIGAVEFEPYRVLAPVILR